MSRGFLLVGLVAASLILVGSETLRKPLTVPKTGDEGAQSVTPSDRSVLADTIRSSITAGAPLVRSLPAEWNGASVTNYTVVEAPALCGVAGRSLTWITEGTAPGTYDVRLQATHSDTPPDTLVLQIEVTP